MKDQTILYVIGVIILVILLGISLFNNNGLGSNSINNYESYNEETRRNYEDMDIDQYIDNIENTRYEYQETDDNTSSISDLIADLYKEYMEEQSSEQASDNYDEGSDDPNYNELNFIDFINGNSNKEENKTNVQNNNVIKNDNNVNIESKNDDNAVTFNEAAYSGFYYNGLTSTQKEIYGKIVDACKKYDSKIKLNKNDINDTSIAQAAILYDHPEFYWTTQSMIITQSNKAVEIQCNVPQNAKTNMEQIDKKVAQIISQSGTIEKDKIKYFYDWIVENTEYEKTNDSQNMLSVFLNGKSVCAGYSRAFQYLCQKAGIYCIYVPGTTKENEPHAWNLVRINGNYYWVDVTWGDPIFAETDIQKTNYNYLLVSDSEFLNNHTIEKTVRMDDGRTIPLNVNYPSCTDDSLNYYNQKGCYFHQYDKNEIESYIRGKLEEEIYTDIEFKFSSVDDYNKFIEDFFSGDSPKIFDVLRKMKKFRNKTIDLNYYLIEEMYYVEISFTMY